MGREAEANRSVIDRIERSKMERKKKLLLFFFLQKKASTLRSRFSLLLRPVLLVEVLQNRPRLVQRRAFSPFVDVVFVFKVRNLELPLGRLGRRRGLLPLGAHRRALPLGEARDLLVEVRELLLLMVVLVEGETKRKKERMRKSE